MCVCVYIHMYIHVYMCVCIYDIGTMLLPLEMPNTSFSSYEDLGVAEHQNAHAADATVAHRYHLFV